MLIEQKKDLTRTIRTYTMKLKVIIHQAEEGAFGQKFQQFQGALPRVTRGKNC